MVSVVVNGKSHQLDVEPETPLLYVLRDNLGLHGPKFGCGLAQCGSCTVLVDGRPVRSCVAPVSQIKGKIVTLEGLGTPEKPHNAIFDAVGVRVRSVPFTPEKVKAGVRV
jgi:aerobic-type carbon monoxide dehydrogenase small subunit (CoxS/CutS family)